MTQFRDRADAGLRLSEVLATRGEWTDAVVVAIEPTAGPVAEVVAETLHLERFELQAQRVDDGPMLGAVPRIRGRRVIVVDAGVETGAMAHAVAGALRAKAPVELVLAVPVCPREALATLELVYDAVIAVDLPMARRSLRWHYASLA